MKNENVRERLQALLRSGRIRLDLGDEETDLIDLPGTRGDRQVRYDTDAFTATVSVYSKGGDTFYRGLRIECRKDMTLHSIEFVTELGRVPREFVFYRTFINAPAAAFARYGDMGLYIGVENPFFSAQLRGSEVSLSFEPSLLLKKGEVYESEPQFLGIYAPSGETVRETEPVNIDGLERGIRRPRFFNPCGEIPLDTAEIDAMRAYTAEYYDVTLKRFDNIFYFFFYPKKQRPRTESEVDEYLSVIDRFSEIGGDIMVFNPLADAKLPTKDRPYWELVPKGSPAEQIHRYAQEKGLRCGYYMGCGGQGFQGNAALLPFRPEKKTWKKKDRLGNIAPENCLGCDEYLEWWYEVQKNTIERYGLGYWAWDPGPGNGNDCWAENHGHLPGKGEYKGWRNSQKLLARLKETFPDLFLMSFYGRKEYGIWGFRYFSQHEVYWENTVLFGATLHHDLHDDRMSAHGVRLQNQWCMNFRFLPAHMGHGLISRMGESWFDPRIDQAIDFGGYRYALLSAIACCGSVTTCNLPDRLENAPGYAEFYRKWVTWAKENYRYCQFTKPIGDRVSNEIIDGFARIDRDSGQIFLFNSSPKIMNKKLSLDRRLGLDTRESFYLRLLYGGPEGRETQYRGEYRMGDVLDITLPPYGAVVMELSRTPVESVREIPGFNHSIDFFTDSSGVPFEYPRHPAYDDLTLTARAVFLPELKRALENAHTANEDFLNGMIPEWHRAGLPFTFTAAQPHRLVLYIPFEGFRLPEQLKLLINGRQVPVETFYLRQTPIFRYAFIEDYVSWKGESLIELNLRGLAENSFLGLHVDYPETCQGMLAERKVFPEHPESSNLCADPALVIDSFTILPDTLSRDHEPFTVSVKTQVPPERIESVFYLHPCQPMVNELFYDPAEDVWRASSDSGVRSANIFLNPTIIAWIKSKDGGIGPQYPLAIRTDFPAP